MPTAPHVNAAVVEMLEAWLARAKGGDMNFIAMVGCDPPAQAGGDARTFGNFAGGYFMEEVAKRGLERLVEELDLAVLNRTMPERDPSLGADFICYNVASATPSYDFISWLVAAEMRRLRAGAPAPLKVGFWMGRSGQAGFELEYRKQMFENVVRPALALIGAVEDKRAIHAPTNDIHTVGPVVEAARHGERVPTLRANQLLPKELIGAVTITLRESKLWPHRNSDIRSWLRFGNYLQRRGEKVVFVRDTARALDPVPGFPTYPPASVDLHARMALYQNAKANLLVSNGPFMLTLFSDRPWLCFTQLQPDGHVYEADTPSFWRKNMKLEEGEQFPWSRPDQRMIWKTDAYPNLMEAWWEAKIGGDDAERVTGTGGLHGHVKDGGGPGQVAGAR